MSDNEENTAFTKRNKSVKIRLNSNSSNQQSFQDTNNQESKKIEPQQILSKANKLKAKHMKLAKRLSQQDPDLPIPGSLEEDFILEQIDNPENFLKIRDSITGQYQKQTLKLELSEDGRPKQYALLGTVDQFLNHKQNSSTQNSVADLKTLQSQSTQNMYFSKSSRFRKVKPEEQYQEKLRQIEQLQKQQLQNERDRLKKLTPGEKLRELRQQKMLEKYNRYSQTWLKVQKELSDKLKKPLENLAFNRDQTHRQKLEASDYISSKASNDEQFGDYVWYMSLRSMSGPKGAFFQLGNPTTALYTQLKERSTSENAVIRKPGALKNSYRSFKEDPYFKSKVQQLESDETGRPKSSELDELYIQGFNKFQLEVECVQNVGVQYVNTDMLDKSVAEEEIIAIHYDSKSKQQFLIPIQFDIMQIFIQRVIIRLCKSFQNNYI